VGLVQELHMIDKLVRKAALAPIDYPSSDGKPMGETPLHYRVMADLWEMLEDWFAADAMTYVAGNMLMYYVEGDPRKQVCPDVFVTRGIRKRPQRDIYLVWQEKKAPDLVIEVTSKQTKKNDLGAKMELYRDVLRVREYFLFDPRAEYLDPPLQGYRLRAGRYVRISEKGGGLSSVVSGLRLEREGEHLRLVDPETGRRLLTPREAHLAAQEQRAQAEQQRAQAEQQRAQAEQRREQADRRLEQAERQRREEAEAAQVEIERLQRELADLRRQL
jgi:Uma2 family endonuclease